MRRSSWPRAGMAMRGSGPNQVVELMALSTVLVFPIRISPILVPCSSPLTGGRRTARAGHAGSARGLGRQVRDPYPCRRGRADGGRASGSAMAFQGFEADCGATNRMRPRSHPDRRAIADRGVCGTIKYRCPAAAFGFAGSGGCNPASCPRRPCSPPSSCCRRCPAGRLPCCPGRPPRPQRRDRRHRWRFLSPKGGRATTEGALGRAPTAAEPCTAFLQRIGAATNWLTNPSRPLGGTAAEPGQPPNPNPRGCTPPTAPNRG